MCILIKSSFFYLLSSVLYFSTFDTSIWPGHLLLEICQIKIMQHFINFLRRWVCLCNSKKIIINTQHAVSSNFDWNIIPIVLFKTLFPYKFHCSHCATFITYFLHIHRTEAFKFFFQRLSEVKEVLEARETKLLQMSKENIDLRETNNILRQ